MLFYERQYRYPTANGENMGCAGLNSFFCNGRSQSDVYLDSSFCFYPPIKKLKDLLERSDQKETLVRQY